MSVKGVAGDRGYPAAHAVWSRSKDLLAGVAASFMSVAYGLSFSALISSRTIRDWLTQALGSAEYADDLVSHCTKLHFNKGDIIAEQGDEAD